MFKNAHFHTAAEVECFAGPAPLFPRHTVYCIGGRPQGLLCVHDQIVM